MRPSMRGMFAEFSAFTTKWNLNERGRLSWRPRIRTTPLRGTKRGRCWREHEGTNQTLPLSRWRLQLGVIAAHLRGASEAGRAQPLAHMGTDLRLPRLADHLIASGPRLKQLGLPPQALGLIG